MVGKLTATMQNLSGMFAGDEVVKGVLASYACCAYQPKVELRTGETKGVEVLMRWRDEDGIIQPPGHFVGLAIELGLIDDLTHFVLAESIASIDAINSTFGPTATISINVAAKQATDSRFMRQPLYNRDHRGSVPLPQ